MNFNSLQRLYTLYAFLLNPCRRTNETLHPAAKSKRIEEMAFGEIEKMKKKKMWKKLWKSGGKW
jgi:hypothetical protein